VIAQNFRVSNDPCAPSIPRISTTSYSKWDDEGPIGRVLQKSWSKLIDQTLVRKVYVKYTINVSHPILLIHPAYFQAGFFSLFFNCLGDIYCFTQNQSVFYFHIFSLIIICSKRINIQTASPERSFLGNSNSLFFSVCFDWILNCYRYIGYFISRI